MTSDAKVGLLLGLVFIFAIAFILNGLPSLNRQENNNQLTTNMLHPQDTAVGLAQNERKIQKTFVRSRPAPITPPSKASVQKRQQDIRFVTALPGKTIAANNQKSQLAIAKQTRSIRRKPVTRRLTSPKTYIVKDGDSLAVIAKRFYGPNLGNKEQSVTAIFQANRRTLKSKDNIYIGQEIIIPVIKTAARKDTNEKIFPAAMFENVKSIGKKHLGKLAPRPKTNSCYVVQQGDSLWQIAAEQLGNGIRFTEIAKLNANVLENQDCLSTGMQLKMPAR